jgi:putative ABC transport system substrate-binding protein
MNRREVIVGLGSAAAWPVVAQSQQAAIPVIGYVRLATPDNRTFVAAFRQGLRETGYTEGQNLLMEFRWPDNQDDLMRESVNDLVRRRVTVIVVAGNSGALAAKAATSTIPVVFVIGADPVELGLVASLNNPGGNVTGVSAQGATLTGKQLDLLRNLIPNLASVAYLVNPSNLNTTAEADKALAAARSLGVDMLLLKASSISDLDQAFAMMLERQIKALMIANDVFFNGQVEYIAALAANHNIPAVHTSREYPRAGGLMGYGSSVAYGHRQAGIYAGRILNGEKPANLPIDLVSNIELVINLKTAKGLALTMPLSLLGRADEVIE